MFRTVLLMLAILVIGGAAAIYVWTAVNHILKGEASALEIVITLAAIAVLAGLVYLLQRLSTNMEDSQ